MNNLRRLLIAALIVLISIPTYSAQIEFRSREIEPKASDYNFKVGNLALDLRYAFGIVYDDNANRSGSGGGDKEEGTKIGNALTVNLDWPLNPHLHIQSGVRFGYIFIASGEGTDGFVVSGTEGEVAGDFSFDLKVGQNGLLTFQEKLAREIDTVQITREDNQSDLSLWRNTLALQYQHQFAELIYGATQVAWRETWADDDKFEFRDNTAFIINGILLAQINSLVQAGPYVQFTKSDFHNRDDLGFRHRDTDDFEVGLNIRYQMSAATTAMLSIGYQEFFVDENDLDVPDVPQMPGERPIDETEGLNDEDDGVAIEFKLFNELSDYIKHRLHFSYRRNPGTSTRINFSEDILTSYVIGWEFTQNWEFLSQFTWLKTNESGKGELADLFINLLGLRYHISPKSNVSFDYRRSEKFSNVSGRDYERDEFRLLFTYDF